MTQPGDMTQIGLFALADRRLAWLDQRQEVLAQDVANIDTPSWQARDLKPFSAVLTQASLSVTPEQTDKGHLAGTLAGRPATDHNLMPSERGVDGNDVKLDDELTKIAQTDNSHELVTDLYRKYLGLFRIALGKG